MSNSKVERRRKGKKDKLKIIFPDMIEDYNQYMGGRRRRRHGPEVVNIRPGLKGSNNIFVHSAIS
jgi:hypothetical protein